MNNIVDDVSYKMFDSIKYIDELGREYWLARELMKLLGYNKWEKFANVIKRAKTSCVLSENNEKEHFPQMGKMVQIGSNTFRTIIDYRLSRYACYLIAQNSDSRKKAVALAQSYFAVQTRKQEILNSEYSKLSEDERRIYQRELVKKGNTILSKTAISCGVKNFDRFHNAGYKGLYNEESANDIAKRKGLNYREDVLDNMDSTELAINLFRITQTDEKLKKDKVDNEYDANSVHYNVGREIRNTIKRLDGTMPENIPAPKVSLKQIKKPK